ncbi:oligosaccharide flippase family protein [Paraglaciecola aquimarina]|uniref:Oligosaccharide flippase family protein n=1 Tax=Paraglaciecola algarum TaxID=3050085 RepID=A0ABS9D4Q5_9ALTE|nr:oligosaccharide flippase family protein [Paraglaciecola sp. G1-23]MCF2947755.1 oligosaccharide flippase family protein [Paraglaciecola sp. G1-23]
MLTIKHGIIASSLNVLNQFIRRMIGIVSLIILARVLTPEDFGLVAIALIFLNFVDVVTNIGGRAYLLSREEIDDVLVLSNWTLQFIIKNTVGVGLAIASIFIADFYEEQRLIPILLVFSLQIFISTSASPGIIYKHKNQDLGAITRWQIISRFVTTGITIFVAVIYETYWALVIGQFLVTLSGTIASYIIAPLKPRFTLKNAKEQWIFSRWIMPQSLINFFRSQIDALYVSNIFDKATMGAYNSMRYYANIPATVFIQPIISTTLTQFSQFKNNPSYFIKQLQVAFYCLSAIAAPIMYLISKYDIAIVKIVLGEKWIEYAALLGTFSALVLLSTMNSILSQIVMLKDATRLLLFYSILCVLTQGLMFTLVDFRDVYQLAEYKMGTDVILSVIFYIYIIWRLLSLSALREITLPIFVSIFSVAFTGAISRYFPNLTGEVSNFLLACFMFSSIYLLTQICLMYIFRSKIYCFDYILKKSEPIIKRVFK